MHTSGPRAQRIFLPDISCPSFLCIPDAAAPVHVPSFMLVSLEDLDTPLRGGVWVPYLRIQVGPVTASTNRMWHCVATEASLEKVVWSGISKMAE